jgi:hypothetical protein
MGAVRCLSMSAAAIAFAACALDAAGVVGSVPINSPDAAAIDAATLADTSGTDGGEQDTGADAVVADATSDADADAVQCDLSKPFGTPTQLPGHVNDLAYNASPRVLPDELTIYFESNRVIGSAGGFDLWTATRTSRDASFDTPLLVPGVNTPSNEYDPMPSADQLSILFASDVDGGLSDILGGTRSSTTSPFSSISAIPGIAPSTSANNQQPFLRADGQELWFASDRSGGIGKFDIYRAPAGSGSFANAAAVVALNSPEDEWLPYLSRDGLTVFFSSTRPGPTAHGGLDIWTAHRATMSSPFSAPTNIAELNTNNDETLGSVSPDGCRIYFARGLDAMGPGPLYIYVAERP